MKPLSGLLLELEQGTIQSADSVSSGMSLELFTSELSKAASSLRPTLTENCLLHQGWFAVSLATFLFQVSNSHCSIGLPAFHSPTQVPIKRAKSTAEVKYHLSFLLVTCLASHPC